jgi:putative phosphoesterase
MKFLILSDTHGNYRLAIKALEAAGRVDRIFYLGDGIDDARLMEELTGHSIIKVPGNCDLSAPEPPEIQTVLAGKTFFVTHGDRYNVKSGLSRLHQKASRERAQIVLYGHTHQSHIGEIDGILYVNPGCLRFNWSPSSYALLTIDSGINRARIIQIAP